MYVVDRSQENSVGVSIVRRFDAHEVIIELLPSIYLLRTCGRRHVLRPIVPPSFSLRVQS